MITADFPASLDRLVELGRTPDVNIRPVLLRVLVDLFVSRSNHGTDALRQFDEIVSRLIEDADDTGRLIVAEKLATHPQTPLALLKRLVAERGAVAGAILSRAGLDSLTLQGAAVLGTTDMAVTVAGRPNLDEATVRALAERPEAEVLAALADNPATGIDTGLQLYLVRRAREHADLAQKLLGRGGDPVIFAALFLAANRTQRLAILTALRRHDLGRAAPEPVPNAAAARDQIARIALRPGQDGLALVLCHALGLPAPLAEAIVDDPGGEPLAVALAALDVEPEIAARVFILGPPVIGHCYDTVRSLVGIVETVSAGAARRLLASLTGEAAPARRGAHRAEGAERQASTPRPFRAAPAGAVDIRKAG